MATKLWQMLFVVKQNQIRMMQARGYTVPDAVLLDYTFEQFETYYKGALEAARAQGETAIDLFDVLNSEFTEPKTCLVWYTPQQKNDVPVEDIRALVEYMTDEKGAVRQYKELVIISYGRITTKNQQVLSELGSYVQHFMYKELKYNPTQHVFAVPHRRLGKKETLQLLRRLGVPPQQLPTIWDTDPIVKYYGFRPNSIIECSRSSVITFTPTTSLFYRRVVVAPLDQLDAKK